MHPEDRVCAHKFSIEETEEGYAVHFKGDKEKLKAKFEAIEAYHNFREKAKAAGIGHHSRGKCDRGLLSLIHKHIQVVHQRGKEIRVEQANE